METFKTKLGGVEKEFLVRAPKAEEVKEANKVKSRGYWKAIKDGLPMANDAIKLAQQTAWTPEKVEEYVKLQKELNEAEKILTEKRNLKLGGPKDPNQETMFRVALKCFSLRNKLSELNSIFAEAQQNTVEGYSENERLNYILYATTVYKDTGERVFESFEDFDKSTISSEENSEKYIIATLAFAMYQQKLLKSYQTVVDGNPENAFLKRFKFINDEGEFIDKDGNLIDSSGEVVVDEVVTDDEPKPFLDNEGNPIEDEEYLKELADYKARKAARKPATK